MRVDKTYTVAQRGVGKPDYSKEVSSARERRGLRLAYRQTLEIFGVVFTDVYTGTHTAANHATIMTDTAALFIADSLIGLTIVSLPHLGHISFVCSTGYPHPLLGLKHH